MLSGEFPLELQFEVIKNVPDSITALRAMGTSSSWRDELARSQLVRDPLARIHLCQKGVRYISDLLDITELLFRVEEHGQVDRCRYVTSLTIWRPEDVEGVSIRSPRRFMTNVVHSRLTYLFQKVVSRLTNLQSLTLDADFLISSIQTVAESSFPLLESVSLSAKWAEALADFLKKHSSIHKLNNTGREPIYLTYDQLGGTLPNLVSITGSLGSINSFSYGRPIQHINCTDVIHLYRNPPKWRKHRNAALHLLPNAFGSRLQKMTKDLVTLTITCTSPSFANIIFELGACIPTLQDLSITRLFLAPKSLMKPAPLEFLPAVLPYCVDPGVDDLDSPAVSTLSWERPPKLTKLASLSMIVGFDKYKGDIGLAFQKRFEKTTFEILLDEEGSCLRLAQLFAALSQVTCGPYKHVWRRDDQGMWVRIVE